MVCHITLVSLLQTIRISWRAGKLQREQSSKTKFANDNLDGPACCKVEDPVTCLQQFGSSSWADRLQKGWIGKTRFFSKCSLWVILLQGGHEECLSGITASICTCPSIFASFACQLCQFGRCWHDLYQVWTLTTMYPFSLPPSEVSQTGQLGNNCAKVFLS